MTELSSIQEKLKREEERFSFHKQEFREFLVVCLKVFSIIGVALLCVALDKDGPPPLFYVTMISACVFCFLLNIVTAVCERIGHQRKLTRLRNLVVALRLAGETLP